MSLLAFCLVNALIDVESLHNMIMQQRRIHTFLHTYLGASIAAAYVIALFIGARWLARRRPDDTLCGLKMPAIAPVGLGSAFGAWSHVLLDSIMHADITPLAPWSLANPLFQIIPTAVLQLVCVACGGLAVVWFLLRSGK